MQTDAFDTALGASYLLVEVVGQGATGQVWRAVDRRTDETVAAKMLRTEHVSDRDLVTRFVQERSVLTGLRHPNLVAVRDLVVEGDRLAIVMDYLDGGSLRDVIRERGAFPPQVAVTLAAEVFDGLAAAHATRLVHRDIKPDNVLLTHDWEDGEPGSVRLTDFGIARIVGEGDKTTTGLLGTPEYMSPELLTTGGADLPSDVYGMGILLYELLAARTPFAGPGTEYTVAHRHVSSQPPRLPVPDVLWEALEKLLDKDPRQRPQARQAADLLRRIAPGLADLPRLETQPAPEEFESARGPVTMVRGMSPTAPTTEPDDPVDGAGDGPGEERVRLEDLDLGTPGSATMVRPMQRRDPAVNRPRTALEPEEPPTPWYRERRLLAIIAGTLVLVVGVAFIVLHGGSGKSAAAGAGSGSFSADLRDEPLPSGLTVGRSAQYDAASKSVALTFTFATQTSPLSGPFFVVIPGSGSQCPTLNWKDSTQSKNQPSTTGIQTDCSWSVDVGQIAKQSSASVTAEVSLPFETQDKLQAWVAAGATATAKEMTDPQLTSSSYAAQRLQSVEVRVPSRTVSGKSLQVSLYPVWPKGVDENDRLYQSPSVGAPSTLLDEIAGGVSGVKLTDACSGGVTVSADGLDVTTLRAAQDCAVGATVGNLTDLTSNTFVIASRGG